MSRTKLLLFLLTVLVLACAMPAAFAAPATVGTVAELKTALADPTVESITISADLTLSEKITVSRDVTIDGTATITRGASYTGTLIEVAAGAELSLKNITIDGDNSWKLDEAAFSKAQADNTRVEGNPFYTPEEGAPLAKSVSIAVKGTMNLNGVTIKNHAGSAGVFNVAATGSLTMDNTSISHCASTGSSVVYFLSGGGSVTINSGTTIDDIYGSGNGIVSRTEGKTTVNGGSITNSRGINCNGSVFMAYGPQSAIEINGGVISSNVGLGGLNNGWCCPIYLHSNSKFVMTGGRIENNSGNYSGGIYSQSTNKQLEISGGFIVNNVSRNPEQTATHDMRVGNPDVCVLTGGTYSQLPDEAWIAEGYVAYDNRNGTWTVMLASMVPTGDASDIALWSAMTLFGAACIVLLSRKRAKQY